MSPWRASVFPFGSRGGPSIGNRSMTTAERKRRQREKSRPTTTVQRSRGRDKSVTVDPAFWDALHEIASERGQSVSNLLASIDADREQSSFSSAIRVFILQHYTDRLAANRRDQGRATDARAEHPADRGHAA